MTYYSKLIAAVVGLLIMMASRYGLDLEAHTQAITDVVLTIATTVAVYLAKNKPTTVTQVEKAREIASEGAKEVREG